MTDTVEKIKLCRDCYYFQRSPNTALSPADRVRYGLCTRASKSVIDPVTGERALEHRYAWTMRKMEQCCGSQGRWWLRDSEPQAEDVNELPAFIEGPFVPEPFHKWLLRNPVRLIPLLLAVVSALAGITLLVYGLFK